LKRCSRCHVAWYCSSECQTRHFKDHRAICKQIAEDEKCLELAAIPLRHFVDPEEDNAVAENILETRAGELGDIAEAQDYFKARIILANSYWTEAYMSEVKEVWEKSLFHFLELLRLYHISCPLEICFRVPFLLLYLNRDDEAYTFIRYWIELDNIDDEETLLRHKRSREGDWIYPVEPNCRYRDMFEDYTKLDGQEETEPYLMALAINKMRIVASNDFLSRALDYTLHETDGRRIQQVRSVVQEMLIGNDNDVASQRQQRDRLLDKIDFYDSKTLGIFLTCEPVSEARQFMNVDDVFRGEYDYPLGIALANGFRSFFRIPGAVDLVRQRV
jgi:hypothetical protein